MRKVSRALMNSPPVLRRLQRRGRATGERRLLYSSANQSDCARVEIQFRGFVSVNWPVLIVIHFRGGFR